MRSVLAGIIQPLFLKQCKYRLFFTGYILKCILNKNVVKLIP
jgi:hypothetical protein